MSSSRTKTWDLSKRFLKHSEALLLANPKSVEDLILLHLKALKEVLGPKDCASRWGDLSFSLEKQKLVGEQRFLKMMLTFIIFIEIKMVQNRLFSL